MEASHVMLQRPITDVWVTPAWLFTALEREFHFTLDPCCDIHNAQCETFFTETDNGLMRDWGRHTVFMNPPHSKLGQWVRKAFNASHDGALVVCLVPARTDTFWWHDCALKGEIRFIRGRLKFGDRAGRAPFPSAVVIFRPPRARILSLAVQTSAHHE
jgi:phage N-6-adenine-methyltransferase